MSMPKNDDSPTAMVFDKISNYWAEIADANDTEKQLAFVKNNLGTAGLVLDLNCGSGRHAVPLYNAGYDMMGLDVSPRLLRIAKVKAVEEGADLALVRADMRFLPFRHGVFAGIISLDSSLGYLPSADEDQRSINEVARTLAGTGIFLLDVFNGDCMQQRHNKFSLRGLVFGWPTSSCNFLRWSWSLCGGHYQIFSR